MRPTAPLAGVAVATATALAVLAPGAPAGPEPAERGRPAGDGRGGFHLTRVGSFDQPVYVHGPRGAGDFGFVVEREGRVKMFENGRKLHGAFLNITGRVSCCRGERGLFSIAFPDWKDDRRFFVYYTDGEGDIRIDEFKRSANNRRDALESSGRHVLQIRHRAYDNHYGGQLQFGPDGHLYATTGDGGGGGDPLENAQDKDSLLGKLLRIKPFAGGGRPYHIPDGNPYRNEPGQDEIFARGLRNTWRFSFDGEKLFLADVGQQRREEVTQRTRHRARAANFGWDVYEGTLRYEAGSLSRHDKPIHQYDHGSGRCSITGGYVSRKVGIPSLWGRYIYGDLCTGVLRSFIPDPDGSRDDKALGVDDKPGLTSFGEDAQDNIYVAQQSGGVFKIVDN